MLIDINLLQEKDKKIRRSVIIILSVILLSVIACVILLFQIHALKGQLVAETEELTAIKQLRELEEQKLASGENLHSLEILESSIIWAEQTKIDTVMILQHMTKLLPERGFIVGFTYTNNNSVELELQFDESKNAAFYLTQLNRSEWISDAKLLSIVENDTIYKAEYSILLKVQAFNEERGTGEGLMPLKINKKDALIIATIAVIGAVIFTILFFLTYKPAALKVETIRNELVTEQQLLKIIESKKVNENSGMLENTEELQRRIPVKPMADQFLLDIENAEINSGVSIKEIHFSDGPIESFETGEETDPEEVPTSTELPKGMQKLTADIVVETEDYFAFEDFLTKIEALKRIVKVEAVSFIAPEENTKITFHVAVSAYYMPTLNDLIDHLPQIDAPSPANKKHPFN